MPALKHTTMREDISLVNARAYSAARTDVTIQMALDSIGALPRRLLLTDEDDGIWTLANDVTIPANVDLCVPLGVTLNGPGDLTIVGGLHAWRWPVHLGPGQVVMATTPALKTTMASLFAHRLEANTLRVNQDVFIDGTLAVGDTPTPVSPDGSAISFQHYVVVNQAADAATINRYGTLVLQHTGLTMNSPNSLYGGATGARVDSGGFSLLAPTGKLTGFNAQATVAGTGGAIDWMNGLEISIHNYGPTVAVTNAFGVLVHGHATGASDATGPVSAYTAIRVNDSILGTTSARALELQFLSRTGAHNLYISGTAPNYLAGNVGIGAGTTDPKHTLYVSGRSTLGAPNSAPTDTDLANSQLSFYLNQAGNQLLVRVKYSDGTLKLATLSLT